MSFIYAHPILSVIGFCFALLFSYLGLRARWINRQRPLKRKELRHHIDMIMDPNGCELETGYAHFSAAMTIRERFGIDFFEVGFKGCEDDLFNEVEASGDRAEARAALHKTGYPVSKKEPVIARIFDPVEAAA